MDLDIERGGNASIQELREKMAGLFKKEVEISVKAAEGAREVAGAVAADLVKKVFNDGIE